MKKISLYFFIFLAICFIIPAILTKQIEKTDTMPIEAKNEVEEKKYSYNKYGKIRLLHAKTNEVEEVNLDEYLYHVVSSEMPADFELEALKAQAVVARTYTIYKMLQENKKHENADICDQSTCCQAWISKEDRLNKWEESVRESNWQKIEEAVNQTAGTIVTYEGNPINALFHSNSGGKTEIPINVWSGSGNYPYLQAVETAGEEGYKQYLSEIILSKEELLSKLKEKYPNIKIDFEKDEIKILDYTEGNRVKTIQFGNTKISGVEARSILGLKSSNFEIKKEEDKYKFIVKGYGHGVGMSQTGADNLAKQGKKYDEIIKHFYIGTQISDINSL